ncbi:MAG: hypothetical protein IPN57_00440 [Ignavibacteria bacterium]|nr:hypothetical protein [Ignavibacteria bacterium]MBL0107697.1 hypothetical protein [Ignavibacteria bacterium]
METNKKAEDILNSIDDINKSVPDDLLFNRILNGYLENDKSFLKDNNNIGKLALAFAVLVIINIFTFFNIERNSDNKSLNSNNNYSKAASEFAKTYFSETDEYNYNK